MKWIMKKRGTSVNIKQTRYGFTLTEVAIVLGVMSAIIAGIWTVVSSVSESRKESDAISELQIVVQNMLNAYQGHTLSNYTSSQVITSNLLGTGVIPSAYQDVANSTGADTPWSLYTGSSSGFVVWANTIGPSYFRPGFFNTSNAGCIAIILQATNCQAGQAGCPVDVYTNALAANICTPNQSNCPNSSATYSATNIGWGSMTPSVAATMCQRNPTNGGSVEFDYSL